MKDSSWTTGPVGMERWLVTLVMPTKVSSWTTWNKGEASSTWRTATSTKDSFSRADGTARAKYYSQTQPSNKASGYRTKSNDTYILYIQDS